jgi:hypothetical protein
MYNVTWRRVRATKPISITYFVCVCSLRYLAWNSHAPYCHLRPIPLYYIFPHYLINGMIFGGKKLFNTKCAFWFSLQLVWNTSYSTIWSKMYISLQLKSPLYFSDHKETWIFSTDFRKMFKYQISWKYVQWESRCFMRTGGQAWS